MTTLYASIGGVDKSSIVKRIEIWRESLNGIGRFEALFDNTGHVLGPTPQDAVELKVNDVSLLKGYVDDVLNKVSDSAAVYLQLVRILGRDYGQDLANLFYTREYFDDEFDDIVDDVLAQTGSEITFTSPHALPQIDLSFKRDYLIDKFREGAKLTNSDFYVDDNKALHLFALTSPESSGVTLKSVAGDADNNILSIEESGEAVGLDIRNYLHVQAGDVNDHWTEGNTGDFTGVNCTLETGTDFKLAGQTSIKATVVNQAQAIKFYIAFPKYNYTVLDFSKVGSVDCHLLLRWNQFWSGVWKHVYLEDSAGRSITWRYEATAYDAWRKVVFKMGPDNPIQAAAGDNVWVGDTSFDWSSIKKIGIATQTPPTGAGIIWLDGLYLNSVPAIAIAQDGTSQGAYRKRMIPLTRNDILSQKQLDAYASDELAKRKDPARKLRVVAAGQTGLKYAGQSLVVNAPDSGISSVTYRILSLHHIAEPKADLLRGHDFITELELVKHEASPGPQPTDPLRFLLTHNPTQILMRRMDERLRSVERGASRVSPATGGAGGGGGTHNLLDGVLHPDTLAGTVAAGDFIYGNATPKWARRAVAVENRVIKVISGLPNWGQVDWGELTGKPATYPPSSHEHAASDITSAILAAARGGLGKALSPTWTDDYILVYDSVTDTWIMEAKGAPAAHNHHFWKDASSEVLSLNNSGSVAFTDLDLTSATSANAKFALLMIMIMDTGAAQANMQIRKNGTTPVSPIQINTMGANLWNTAFAIVGLDSNRIIEYAITATGANTCFVRIAVVGYIE